MTIKRGELYLADMPDQGKPRPAIVLTANWLSRYARDITVVPITSVARANFPTRVELAVGEGGLSVPSWAKCDQVTTVPVQRLRSPAWGRLDDARLAQIEAAVRLALGL